jgi:predicted dehydrogenase
MSLGIAVVGRRFGTRVQVPALRAAGFEVVALVGRDRDKTAYKAGNLGIPNACGSLAEAFALPGVDAVAIATPPNTHFALALEAVEAGRHVLCEKPFTTDAYEAAQLVAAVERAGVVGALGHEFRWNPARAAVGVAITSGAIGEVRLATIVDYSAFLHNPAMSMPSWFETPGIGGWLGANGSHTLDQLRVWLGPFASVSAALLTTAESDREVEDAYSVRFTMRSGTEVVLQQVGAAWTDRGFVAVTGTRGTVGIDRGDAWIADAEGTRPLEAPAGSASGGGSVDGDDLDALGGYEQRHYEQLGASFRAAIEGRVARDAPVALPTFADGLAVMRCIDAMRASAAAGGQLQTIDGG